ncbi:hypothetical protein GIB67_018512 [Kingdonia uniflora]|uniref:DNA-directed RNA polymerase subunit n=1 Tax=Kingdonia uniflora TaxID=39325 RepID=A0A7J7LW96_9MAGN|nr:hypothetical protein GIB67_018512 [Kingdonia uniflora]
MALVAAQQPPSEFQYEFTKQPYTEDVPNMKIDSICFSKFSGPDIQKLAEVQIWRDKYYEGGGTEPGVNGLLDKHLGPASMTGGKCATCHGDWTTCAGHWGHLKLVLPVFNIGFLPSIIDTLKCICKSCARVLLPEETRRERLRKMRSSKDTVQKSALAKAIVKECKPKQCYRCGYSNGLTSISVISLAKDSKALAVPVLNPVRILALFRRMLDEDCELLYLSERPENFIVTDIAVPPISIRPSVVMSGGAMSDARGIPPNPQQKPLRGIVQRLKGKQGRFRGNLCGKRVQWTGRTVISPDPNLKITEVAIPVLMAKILSYPEIVSQHNIEKLRHCVCNGSNKYPGANYIKKVDGTTLNLRYRTRNAANELKYGDIVERHVEDGDIVLFNRQPSLHRMSIMAHRARVMPWRTLRFNESVCNPYNADFDGDEMNMHLPRTEEARTEALMLMGSSLLSSFLLFFY